MRLKGSMRLVRVVRMCFTVELSMREHLMRPSRRRRLNLVRNVVLLTKGSRTSDD